MSRPNFSSGTAQPVPTSTFSVGPESESDQPFVERRRSSDGAQNAGERRQFGSSHAELSEEGRELAAAIDQYKVSHHRRYLTCDEMLTVIHGLGYAKPNA